jgi:hypothetical protein
MLVDRPVRGLLPRTFNLGLGDGKVVLALAVEPVNPMEDLLAVFVEAEVHAA